MSRRRAPALGELRDGRWPRQRTMPGDRLIDAEAPGRAGLDDGVAEVECAP